MPRRDLIKRVCSLNLDWVRAKLGAVEEKCGLCGGVTLVCHGCRESSTKGAGRGREDQVSDLATEREEVTNFFFGGRGGDVGDVDGLCVRHSFTIDLGLGVCIL